VSLSSTYLLYFIASFMFFEPWHMFTSFVQYLLLSPSYINVLNIYAFCNVHDISWGTKGPDVPPPLKGGVVVTTDGQASVSVPGDDKDLDEQYEEEMNVLTKKAVVETKKVDETQSQKDYYANMRSGVVLAWMFTNFALAAAILNSAGLDRLVSGDEDSIESKRSKVYLAVVLWTVAALSAFRFMGCTWFLVLRLVSFLLPSNPPSVVPNTDNVNSSVESRRFFHLRSTFLILGLLEYILEHLLSLYMIPSYSIGSCWCW